jgi:hypothetical protein
MVIRKANNLDNDLVARPSSFRTGVSDRHGIAEDASVDPNQRLAPLFEVAANKRVSRSLDHFLNLTGPPTTATSPTRKTDQNDVPVLGVGHVFGVDEDVLLKSRGLDGIGDQPGRAALRSPQRAANEVVFANFPAGEMQFAVLEPAHFSLTNQCLDGFVELAAGTVFDSKPPGQASRFHRLGIAFRKELDDFFLK